MIVRREDGRLHLITQPDHAAAARLIMDRWEALRHAERRESILLAVGEHDNGWREVDASPLVNPADGRIFDFITVPIEERHAVWPRGVKRLAEHDAWAAALVAHHAVFVYERYRTDAGWFRFFTEMEAMRAELVSSSGKTTNELLEDYPYLRIGDLISLTFCNRVTDRQTYESWSLRLEGDRVLITPDGFGGGDVPIEVEARDVPDVVYRSDSELRETLRSARVVSLRGTVRSAAASHQSSVVSR
jgi:hypothetical protein